jgi:ABC-type uncharacterized transport system involved in gliding motility auxiliary subunit
LTSGLEKSIIPFVDRSTPIEYELMRSIATLNGSEKKRLGLFVSQKTAFQEYDPDRMGRMKDPEIVTELRKQYDVIDIDSAKPVPDDIDVILAVQPSAWQPLAVENLIAAVRRGVPTAIFEDPQPEYFPNMVDPQQAQMPFMQETETKKLWDLLGVDVQTTQIITHGYNPLKRFQEYPGEIVFVGNGALGNAGDPQAGNKGEAAAGASLFDENDPISSKTQELVFMFAGSIKKKDNAKLKFTPLVRTSKVSGYVDKFDLFTTDPFGGRDLNARRRLHPTGIEYVLAAHIQGPAPALVGGNVKPLADEPATPTATATGTKPAPAKNEVTPSATASATAAPAASATPSASATAAPTATATPSATATSSAPIITNPYVVPTASVTPSATASSTGAAPTATPSATAAAKSTAPRDMNVVVVTDVDVLTSIFFRLRTQRASVDDQMPNFDNVTFVLNTLDVLAGDDRFVDVRKRRPTHRTLKTLDEINQAATDRMLAARNDFETQFKDELSKEEKRLNDELDKLRNDTKLKQIDKESRLEIFEKDIQRRVKAKEQQLTLRRDKQQKEQMRQLSDEIRGRQYLYKMCAVVLPPIPPLVIGLLVFFNRRAREQEGVSRNRLK